jgi:hypothetical protein
MAMDDAKPSLSRVGKDGRVKCVDLPAGNERPCEMLEGVAHELGNLLSALSAWVECWEEFAPGAATPAQAARHIYMGIGRIRYSLNCLGYSGGIAPSHLTVVDVNRLVKATLDSLNPRGGELTIETVNETELWPVIADVWALEIVLVNLFMDAVMVSQTGEPAVVEVANVNTTAVIQGIGGSLPAGRYVNVAVIYRERYHELQVCDPSDVVRSIQPLSERRLPVTQRILEEHAGLLRITDLPEGRTRVEVFLPSAGRQAGARSTQHRANEWQ